MTSLEQTLQGVLDSVAQEWTVEERALVETVALDYAELVQQRIAGNDVAEEMLQVRAQASGIAAGAVGSAAKALEDGIRDFLADLVSELLPGF